MLPRKFWIPASLPLCLLCALLPMAAQIPPLRPDPLAPACGGRLPFLLETGVGQESLLKYTSLSCNPPLYGGLQGNGSLKRA